MRRLEFIAVVGAFWPVVCVAQQRKIPTIGVLVVGPGSVHFGNCFRRRWANSVNMKTAKAMGLNVAQAFLGRADEVIE